MSIYISEYHLNQMCSKVLFEIKREGLRNINCYKVYRLLQKIGYSEHIANQYSQSIANKIQNKTIKIH